ncbi:MAG: hypothetical protein EP297_09755 [Gammaproteobacteria bacterium]|nr:MAG: hypothetical protein EP297_09755 [Gammaproteobacteria bacterium]
MIRRKIDHILSAVFPDHKKLEERIRKGKKVVVFYSRGCPACKIYIRILLPDITGRLISHKIEVLKLNVVKHPLLFSESSSTTIPTTSIYLDGEVLDSKGGSMSYEVAVPWILETYGINPKKSL